MANCTNCGNEVPAGSSFCTRCGTKVADAGSYTPPNPGGYAPNPGGYAPNPGGYAPNPAPAATSASSWDGGVLETIGASLVYSFIISLTCGIALPWAVCYLYKFILSHLRIDGRRFRFDGDGATLFGNWIVWFLLTAITCGIYGFWVTPKMYNWFASHTHME